ncbi:MAG: 5-histidylcysteine sulfoxide synthase [Methylotenera sp.]|uniref:5-histidylcysteine sulfoxide synthase n=1 Tax=Methylotenera sp. TaxID=2051956 RepID=UPI00271AF5B3|nr:5-histidylcysteine sulfoxide synthase [Methylotenera sp.]MDO9205723.1 5-histidylcysteine sulfoxide synthase [Methylotenera sp.]MDO9392801.1 5-histidylcysteine sulfoxide synthase [Methylotenera sp.]
MTRTLFPRTPILNGNDVSATRKEIRAYFLATFNRYEQLFETLVNEKSYQLKPIALRHPLIFYFGYTATFFINKLLLAGLLNERINPKFEAMFAVGVDEMSWDDLNDAHYDWPSSTEVKHYRYQVREVIDALIQTAPLTLPIDWSHPWWAIIMCIEHERIHLETSSVLIRQQALELVQPHAVWKACTHSGDAPQNELVKIPEGKVYLDKKENAAEYGWDNEYGLHEAHIAEFQASRYLVSNSEFLDFVEDGGYAQDTLWGDEGLQWKNYAEATHPTFWVRKGDAWWLRLMTEEVAMPWDWPAEVNYHEAKAFCHWKAQRTGLAVRLPSEDEWYRLYDFSGVADVANGKIAASNIHLDHAASPCPVTNFRHGELYDVTGNVWQWTETPIYPFSGFAVHPWYDDFTTPTFDGRHNLIKGGSWISSGNETLHSARYAFRRHFFQHAGFRYVVADNLASVPASHYETDKLISEYAEFHYGDSYFGVANFPKTLADIAITAIKGKPARKALDLGCASGRATFELARHFDHVTGIDFSVRLIDSGIQMADKGELLYTLIDEGQLLSYKARTLANMGLDKVREKVEFLQGDACNLKPILTNYDLILAANLIDRLYSPKKFLSSVHERLNIGGILLIASPYTWLEEHTRREEWIGGFKQSAENFTTLDGLKEQLGQHFRLIAAPVDVPFVIRETRRKFQHSLSEVTLWERIT